MTVICIQQDDVAIFDCSSLARIVAHGVSQSELAAGHIPRDLGSFVTGAMAILWAHLQLDGVFCDLHDLVDHALHDKVLARTPWAADEMDSLPYPHVLGLHCAPCQLILAAFEEHCVCLLDPGVLPRIDEHAAEMRNTQDQRVITRVAGSRVFFSALLDGWRRLAVHAVIEFE